MIDRRELLLLATGSAAAASAAGVRAEPPQHGALAGPAPGSVSRSNEIRALREFAERTHPRGRTARDDADWQRRWNSLEGAANAMADGPYLVGARHALAWFEDGHSTVLPFELFPKIPDAFAAGPFGWNLPWKVKVFDDGAYVTAVDRTHRSILGSRVERVGGLGSAELIQRFSNSWPGSIVWAHNWAGMSFASPAQLHGLGATQTPLATLPLALSKAGRQIALSLAPARTPFQESIEIDRKKPERETWAASIGRGNYVKPLPERGAVYLSIDDMQDLKGETFEQLTRDAFAAMALDWPERLVIDLRRNGGGDNFLGEVLRKRIERSRFNRPGGFYVLVGPATFSAAQNLANRLERETSALFVGTPTGLSPNHYGDAKMFSGPATGLMAMVSTLPWFDSYPQDRREWIMPDLPVAATFDDWLKGRDPALDLALSHRAEGTPDEFSGERVFYYGRASQKTPWKPFWA